MTLRMYLVRHGETDGNAEGRSQGRRDVPLNDVGRRQAAAIGERMRDRLLVGVYSSPLARCAATAEAIAVHHAVQVQHDARLAELDHGLLDGLTSEELRRDHAEFLARWRADDPTDLAMPGGESMGDAQRRMVETTEAIAALHSDGEIAVVSHNLATRAFLCHALGVPLVTFRRFRHEVASFAELERLPNGGWLVVRLNEQCHLDA